MSLIADTLAALRRVVLLDHKVAELDARIAGLVAAHGDTRERLVRIEALIEAAQMRRLSRRNDD